ncbi:MAG: hypothetical protein IKD83_04190 [Firmicutes bacterium]|nr:hypothetical protein [Bacillota bacterium]
MGRFKAVLRGRFVIIYFGSKISIFYRKAGDDYGIHNNFYDYALPAYIGSKKKITPFPPKGR